MDEQQMRAACARIAAEWHAGGLAGGSIYEDFAVELAKVVQAAERERIAQHFDARDMGKDGNPRGIGFYDPHEPAEIIRALGPNDGTKGPPKAVPLE